MSIETYLLISIPFIILNLLYFKVWLRENRYNYTYDEAGGKIYVGKGSVLVTIIIALLWPAEIAGLVCWVLYKLFSWFCKIVFDLD